MATTAKTETAKVYKFVSQNKFLTCTALNTSYGWKGRN